MSTQAQTETQLITENINEAPKAGKEEISQEITLFAEPIVHTKNLTITNSLLTSWLAVFIIIILSLVLRAKIRAIPGKLQSVFEMVIEGALGMCDQVTNDRSLSIKIFPLAISAFFFILVSNWLGIMPLGGFGIVEEGKHGLLFVPFLRGATADINTTLALAVMAVIGANVFGVVSIGVWKTLNKYVNLDVIGDIFKEFSKNPSIIIVSPIKFFVGLIEIVGEFAKVASLSFRLFGNVFAGEVLLASMAALMAYIVPIPFLFLEILVGVVQALIFSILLVVYFTIGASDHDEHHEEHYEVDESHRNDTHTKDEDRLIKEAIEEIA